MIMRVSFILHTSLSASHSHLLWTMLYPFEDHQRSWQQRYRDLTKSDSVDAQQPSGSKQSRWTLSRLKQNAYWLLEKIVLIRLKYSFPYCFAVMASKVCWSKDDGFLQGRCRFHCRLVDLSVEREHDVEPRPVVSSHASVLNFTLEVEVREAGVSHEGDVLYELRFVTECRRRWYAGV